MSAYINQINQNWKPLVLATLLIIGLPVAIVVGIQLHQRSSGIDVALQPEVVMLLPPGNDPRQIEVGVKWLKDGYCVGQFRPQATETASQVRLGSVIDRENSNGPCAGVGSAGMAWGDLKLKAPLGNRLVVRASDGATLRVLEANAPPG